MLPVYHLETELQKNADGTNNHHWLPIPHDYAQTYGTVLQLLRSDVYKAIDVGLSAFSTKPGIYSLHDSAHFDEVVRKASEIAYCPANGNGSEGLKPYELFVLLLAIRVHDAGNYSGRGGHEKRCHKVLSDVAEKLLPHTTHEVQVIAEIAAAHGGELPGGNKDTIGALAPTAYVGSVEIRSQRIAALVRIADELAENSQRTFPCLLRAGLIPIHNQIYHRYAEALKANFIQRDDAGVTVKLNFVIAHEVAKVKFGKEDEKVYLIDEIRQRLRKMNQERVYCNQFLAPKERITSIVVDVKIEGKAAGPAAYTGHILLRDEGYPSNLALPSQLQKLTSKAILPTLGR